MSENKMKRDPSKWYTSFYYTDWTGQRHRKKKEGFSKKSEAAQYRKDFLASIAGTPDMSFQVLTKLYLEDSRNRIRTGTRSTRKHIIDRWLLPFFGKLPINQITPITVRKWQNEMISKINPRTGDPYSETYLRTINSVLSLILNYAVQFYNLPSNPCYQTGGFIGKKKAPEMKFWTLQEYKTAEPFILGWGYRVAIMLLFWSGIREGECLALEPADILSDHTIHITKTYHRRNGKDTSGPPKTENSYRDVKIPAFVYQELQKYISSLYDIQPHDRIFSFGKGAIGRAIEMAAAQAGVKRIRTHDLRHSHAALLIHLNFNIVAIAGRLGDSVKVAMETYSHLYPSTDSTVVSNLNTLLKNPPDVETKIVSLLEDMKS